MKKKKREERGERQSRGKKKGGEKGKREQILISISPF